MTRDKHPWIAREGWAHILLALSASLLVQHFWGVWAAAPFWLFLIFCLQFFRDFPRKVPNEPRAVICPADGRVIAVDEVEDPYLGRPCKRICIFMNVVNVHSN